MQALMNNLMFKILDYLAAKKSVCFDRNRNFSDWSINSSSIWKKVPITSGHCTEYNTLAPPSRKAGGSASVMHPGPGALVSMQQLKTKNMHGISTIV